MHQAPRPALRLRERLEREGRTRWLDVGCGRASYAAGFRLLDRFDPGKVPSESRDRYTQLDIVSASLDDLDGLGRFDLVRLQHVLEHMPYEVGQTALRNCGYVLTSGGLIVITAPDLRLHISAYLDSRYKQWTRFGEWAEERVPAEAPDSFYFSIFSHSMPGQEHQWCYDFEGIKYQLEKTEIFTEIRLLPFDDPLAEYPFTHNRPDEDVCVIARRL